MNIYMIAIGIGLLCSFAAYAFSVKGFFQTFKLLGQREQIQSTKAKLAGTPLENSFDQKITSSLRDAVISMILATVLLYFCLIGAGVYVGATANTNQNALCALRTDLELRTKQGKEFLKEHPHGIDSITPSQIQESIINQERSIKALGGLSC